MTEPLLIGTCMLAVVFTAEWVDGARHSPARAPPGWAIVAACMTRYEAWPICAALLGLALLALLRRGAAARRRRSRRACGVAHLPGDRAGPVQRQQPLDDRHLVRAGRVLRAGERGARQRRARVRAGARERRICCRERAWVWPAYVGLALIGVASCATRDRAPLLLVLALAGAAMLPVVRLLSGAPAADPLRPAAGGRLRGDHRGRDRHCCGSRCGSSPRRLVLGWALTQSSPVRPHARR